jgi:hypothetical protein
VEGVKFILEEKKYVEKKSLKPKTSSGVNSNTTLYIS